VRLRIPDSLPADASARLVGALSGVVGRVHVHGDVERTEVLPANEQGKVPSAIGIEFRPRD